MELPDAGSVVSQGKSFGNVESVKATSDVNSPISGEVVEVNSKLSETPGLVSNPHTSIPTPSPGYLFICIIPLSLFRKKMIRFCIEFWLCMKINSSPYEDGWMIKVKPSNPSELESLMGSKEYTKFCEEEGGH